MKRIANCILLACAIGVSGCKITRNFESKKWEADFDVEFPYSIFFPPPKYPITAKVPK